MVETAAKRDPVKKAHRLDALRKKQDALRAKLAKIEAKQKAMVHKDETRLKTIVGSAILAHANLHPETRANLVAVLEKTVTARRDVEFLREKKWL